MPQGVSCQVEECVHNDMRVCKAASIEVRNVANVVKATTSDHTACETFKVR
ncbi:MAG: DUF1540 domain-containing protein [Clostridia bacterium]|nr:DUF1540 domain-containing protein [Clostridia bacterium]